MPLHMDRANFLLTYYLSNALPSISSSLMQTVKLPPCRDKEGSFLAAISSVL